MVNTTDSPVANPTYMEDIRHLFETQDILCMRGQGVELGTYEGVKANAFRVYSRVKEGSMPPQPDRVWSEAWVETFYNWMANDYPRGVVTPQFTALAQATTASRQRKNIRDLSSAEIDKLKTAFQGLMDRDSSDPQSYYALAGIHWLPGKAPGEYYCRHHENAYNPWHRVYLLKVEDALRSVEGCEDVTLPYWDITESTIPELLNQEPFVNYTIPQRLCSITGFCYPTDDNGSLYTTQRDSNDTIIQKINDPIVDIPDNIAEALGHPYWEKFNGWDEGERTQDGIIKAHDNGHNSIGTTMQNQDVAAFDPIFWFFHANWDRLWWKWQQLFGATTVDTFKTHLQGSADWLDDPVINQLPPFTERSNETIDLSSMDIDYIHPVGEELVTLTTPRFGSFLAHKAFQVSSEPQVSVRVKDIDRLKIPGSFDVYLYVGEKIIAKQGFFQSTASIHCATCRKKGIINIDFRVSQSKLTGGKISTKIKLLRPNGTTREFPLSSCGNPTINIRLLLENYSSNN